MREIKYRFYDINDKKMHDVISLEFPLGSPSGKDITIYNPDEDYYEWRSIVDGHLMQYTGLKDKNGTMIFEGDIVKILYTDWASKSENDTRTLEEYLDSLTKVGVVCWDNLSLCYHLKMRNECFGSIHCGKYGYIEVIGNIYDNPELLTHQHEDKGE